MRRVVLVLTAGMALAFLPAAGAVTATAATTTKVVVRPRTGEPHTRFSLSFRWPDTTGASGNWKWIDTLSASVPMRSGCVWYATATLPRSQAGATVRVTLDPSRLGGRWCTGTEK